MRPKCMPPGPDQNLLLSAACAATRGGHSLATGSHNGCATTVSSSMFGGIPTPQRTLRGQAHCAPSRVLPSDSSGVTLQIRQIARPGLDVLNTFGNAIEQGREESLLHSLPSLDRQGLRAELGIEHVDRPVGQNAGGFREPRKATSIRVREHLLQTFNSRVSRVHYASFGWGLLYSGRCGTEHAMCRLVPLLDRIDIHIEVPPVPFRELSDTQSGTNSAQMREQVVVAREIQKQRFAGQPSRLNGKMSPREIRRHCKLEPDAESLLKSAMEEMGLSARAHDKILRISRTIADLDRSERITSGHLSEAINYRTLDRRYWT